MSNINWQERAEAALARATVAESRADALATEASMMRRQLDEFFGITGRVWEGNTPATDAWCREMRAQGVEAFARHCQNRHAEMMATEPNHPVCNAAISAIRRAGEFALYFAHQLRAGAEK